MTKNSRPAAADQTDAQTPAPTTSEQAGDPPAENAAGAGEIWARARPDRSAQPQSRARQFGALPTRPPVI